MNTRKNGLPDRRFTANKAEAIKRKALARRLFIQQLVASAILGFIAGSILISTLWREANKPLITPLVEPMTFEVGKVEAKEPLNWNDAIRQVFPADEAGRMIRICMKENDKPYKWNRVYNRNGSYDFGPCQVNSIHKPKKITFEQWDEYLKDTTNYAKEVRRIYLSQGWNAWYVYKNGLVN
jgi:hypothetical protein